MRQLHALILAIWALIPLPIIGLSRVAAFDLLRELFNVCPQLRHGNEDIDVFRKPFHEMGRMGSNPARFSVDSGVLNKKAFVVGRGLHLYELRFIRPWRGADEIDLLIEV